ncbi:MAG: response regulator [Rhizobiaceae bacterium]|nr:response regulator [Rhizobiaceae bacterium]
MSAVAFILEDEPIIALDIEDLLLQFGCSDAKVFSTADQALRWLDSNTPDFAIIDPLLKDGYCTTVAALLSERSVPFIVYSGNNAAELTSEFRMGIMVLKPAAPDELLDVVKSILG